MFLFMAQVMKSVLALQIQINPFVYPAVISLHNLIIDFRQENIYYLQII